MRSPSKGSHALAVKGLACARRQGARMRSPSRGSHALAVKRLACARRQEARMRSPSKGSLALAVKRLACARRQRARLRSPSGAPSARHWASLSWAPFGRVKGLTFVRRQDHPSTHPPIHPYNPPSGASSARHWARGRKRQKPHPSTHPPIQSAVRSVFGASLGSRAEAAKASSIHPYNPPLRAHPHFPRTHHPPTQTSQPHVGDSRTGKTVIFGGQQNFRKPMMWKEKGETNHQDHRDRP